MSECVCVLCVSMFVWSVFLYVTKQCLALSLTVTVNHIKSGAGFNLKQFSLRKSHIVSNIFGVCVSQFVFLAFKHIFCLVALECIFITAERRLNRVNDVMTIN